MVGRKSDLVKRNGLVINNKPNVCANYNLDNAVHVRQARATTGSVEMKKNLKRDGCGDIYSKGRQTSD